MIHNPEWFVSLSFELPESLQFRSPHDTRVLATLDNYNRSLVRSNDYFISPEKYFISYDRSWPKTRANENSGQNVMNSCENSTNRKLISMYHKINYQGK